MKDGRTEITQAFCAVMANGYLYCIQKGIHFPSDDYSGTPAVLFIWLKAQMICIDSLFIHCWTQHCIYERRQNGPNYSKQCLPVTLPQSKMMKASNWEERSNQRPLVVFCKFKNWNGKHFLLWLTMVDLGLQIRWDSHKHRAVLMSYCLFLLSLTLHFMAGIIGKFINEVLNLNI